MLSLTSATLLRIAERASDGASDIGAETQLRPLWLQMLAVMQVYAGLENTRESPLREATCELLRNALFVLMATGALKFDDTPVDSSQPSTWQITQEVCASIDPSLVPSLVSQLQHLPADNESTAPPTSVSPEHDQSPDTRNDANSASTPPAHASSSDDSPHTDDSDEKPPSPHSN
ncbi:MAG: hypothetical protein MHM6MM_009681 [Cercozoa sp. M6MM]